MTLYGDRSDDELYRMIGAEVSGLAGRHTDDEALVERGRRWFELKLPQLRDAICGNVAITTLIKNGDEAQLATAVVDVVTALSLGVSPVTIVTLLIRMGLTRLCDANGDKPKS
jgi:hypothetical protein